MIFSFDHSFDLQIITQHKQRQRRVLQNGDIRCGLNDFWIQ